MANCAWTCPKCGRVFEYDAKQKLAVSRYKHENRVGGCGPPSKLSDGAPNPEYFKAWYIRNRDRWKVHVLNDYHSNPEPKKRYRRKYYERNKELELTRTKAYQRTPKGLAVHRRAAVKTQARRRGIPILFTLNKPFPGAELHHVEENIGVYIPKAIHDSIRHNLANGKNMVAINETVAEWLSGVERRLSE